MSSTMKMLVFLLLYFNFNVVRGARRVCGGTLTAARGIIHTPNFPGPFNLPINCEWVIDSQHVSSPNTSIVVYLTQLFVFEGLTFTEYQLYGSDYKIHPKVIHKVNETNVSKVRWIQTFQSFLVIQLKMQTMDSAHLRVLDKFLDVYGFNITYEITTGAVRQKPCTMMDCGFTGHCFDHYTKFYCECFPGYNGSTCSDGPKSFCHSGGEPTCKNGATCLHVGVSAVKCHCPKNFTGSTCELTASPSTKECTTCKTVCAYDGRLENACKCLGKTRTNATDGATGDRGGFGTTMHLANLPNLDEDTLRSYIQKQLLKNLQANFSRVDDVLVNSIVHFRSGADVTFHVYGPKKDEKRFRSILNKWADRGYIGNITISEKDTSLRSLLSLQSVSINQLGTIRENDEFILSCVARGSPTMTFRWFKDSIFINATSTSRKWIKLIKDPHAADQYTALLAIERAHPLDEGAFTCQAEDFNVQQCLSRQVKIGRRPTVKIEPMSLTVRKGGNFTIKCVSLDGNGGVGSKYTYSWTKNKELLPVRTETEKYEVLYPSGTILQVVNAEKDVQYSCLVQDGLTSSESSVSVHVVDRKGIHTCAPEVFLNASWPETAPDTNSILECPKGYSGVAKRYCALRDGKKPTWELPNYSECIHREIQHVRHKFEQLKLGYMAITPNDILQNFLDYLRNNSHDKILPGESAQILILIQDVILFFEKTRIPFHNANNITTMVLSIADEIMTIPNSLTKPNEVRALVDVINSYLRVLVADTLKQMPSDVIHYPLNTIDVTVLNLTDYRKEIFHVPANQQKNSRYDEWYGVQISGPINKETLFRKSKFISSIVFRNLSRLLAPRSYLRIKDGSELEYELYSQIVSILQLPEYFEMYPIAIDFKHDPSNNITFNGDETWTLTCGYADISTFTYTWDIYSCYPQMLSNSRTRCICPKSGIFALLLTLMPPKPVTEESNPRRYILLAGCGLCMILALFTTVCLVTSCMLLRISCIVALKLQCSISVFATGLLFMLAILTGPPQNYFMIFITALETFFLLGMSSHLSKLLIVFTELTQLPKPMASKYTVIGIISGVPVITVFGSHLSYRTMDIKLESWWMLRGTLAFNIFVGVVSIISVLFIFLYIVVMKKLNELIAIHEKYTKPIEKRVALLRRSGYIFSGVTLFSVSSIVYINYPNKLWSIYQFSIYNVFLGLLLLFCYVLKAETQFRQMFQKKSNMNSEDKFFSFDSTSSPLNFLTKQDPEVENESGPHHKPDHQQFTLQTVHQPKSILVAKSQNISSTFDSCLHTNTSFCDSTIEDLSTPQPPLECYNSSPQTFRKYSSITNSQSPDILSNKVCVELDLVASSLQSSTNKRKAQVSTEPTRHVSFPPKVVISPDDAIAKILESETVIVPSEHLLLKSEHERTQPDGHDEYITTETSLETVKEEEEEDVEVTTSIKVPTVSAVVSEEQLPKLCDDKLDGMLDSISHDLDYLLNRSEEVDTLVQTSSLRRVSKPPGANVKHKIPEELLSEETNIPESVTLRTNC